jgi:L-malate glycosyltransferase
MSAKPPRTPVIGLLWAQFSAYHVDRLEAVGRRMDGRARVLAVEVSASSKLYAWEPSGTVKGTEKFLLFPGKVYEAISPLRRFWRQLRVLRRCDVAFIGVAYSEPDIIFLAFTLRFLGVKVVMMTASKFDDRPRRAVKELLKSFVLSSYHAAIVGGCRQHDYVRFLGFRERAVRPGYNTVSMRRVREQASKAPQTPFAERAFIFVGRFVDKKNIETMLEAYANYSRSAGALARPLVMIGDGPLRPVLDRMCDELGITGLVQFTGFLTAPQVSERLAASLTLVLVSAEEQWGLVINEAVAVGLPIIASSEVGAREALVRNLVNGFVVQSTSAPYITLALLRIGASEDAWQRMSARSLELSWMADTERFADAVELTIDPLAEPARTNQIRFENSILAEASEIAPEA